MTSEQDIKTTAVAFIDRWKASGASERANCQPFLIQLSALIGAAEPDTASDTPEQDAYAFERPVTFNHPDGSTTTGFIDLYKRGCFVLEAKQGSDKKDKATASSSVGAKAGKTKKGTAVRGTKGWDDAMVRARAQAESYAKALTVEEGWPPFLIVTDVGHTIELFADFSLTGKNYTHFPDKASFRIKMDDLHNDKIRERLRMAWTDPLALDPTRISDKVTREIADKLAALAKSLEGAGRAPESVATFLMRCLFTMFAEDVGLLPEDSFKSLMERYVGKADKFHLMAKALWDDMNKGTDFSAALETDIRRFNGGLFANAEAILLTEDQLKLLIDAAAADWRDVEPAIFGTLLERALEPRERHKLGAHYTPRAYVERLVMPTIIEPLKHDWENVKTAAVQLANAGDVDDALKEVSKFHQSLCSITVLDPACGSGNFLYVTMEHMKRLEGEVLDLAEELGQDQYFLEMDQHTVDPHQFLGLEINPRAVPITELVLWIGHLQWHFKTRGKTNIAEPILKNFKNIRCQDALIEYEGTELVTDEHAKPISRWDGRTTKASPTTGKEVPDETARVPVERYLKPKPTAWPKADFIVGNPPFLGNKVMREGLGDGYVEALRETYNDLPGSIDFVMYWWHKAAELVRTGKTRRFGYITTNSLQQAFSRRVVERHLGEKKGISLIYAVPDHPWVDAADGAAVRISMTVGIAGNHFGRLDTVRAEAKALDRQGRDVLVNTCLGKIHSNLQIGADLTSVRALKSNALMSWQGCKLVGADFQISTEQYTDFVAKVDDIHDRLPMYWAGRDLTANQKKRHAIDFYGLTEQQARSHYPNAFQYILDHVKPQRDQVRRRGHREKWWIFGEPRPGMRAALSSLQKYIVTSEVSKHRFFTFLRWPEDLIDGSVIAIAHDDPYILGIVSSYIHICWSLASAGTLEDRPRYQNQVSFNPFPFPDATNEQKAAIRDLAEELDAHRKQVQANHLDITLTGMYNALEKLKSGDELTDKEKDIHERGLVSILKDLHERLDAAVFAAYGWDADMDDDAILVKLVALNHERAKEEAAGTVRWLRPEYQAPDEAKEAKAVQTKFDVGEGTAAPVKKQPWPKTLPEQVAVVRAALDAAEAPMRAEEVARCFTRANKIKVAEVLTTLETLSQIHRVGTERFAA